MGTVNRNESFIKSCAFHDGYNTGIGAFGINGLVIQNNVIHHVVGAGIRVTGASHEILNNLIVYVIAPGSYKDTPSKQDVHWPAGIEVDKAQEVTLRNNVIAGSERIGFLIAGEHCSETDPLISWNNNEAHGCLHGVQLFKKFRPGCSRISNFYAWKNWDFGIYAYPGVSVIVKDCVVADNGVNLLLSVHSPPSLKHIREDKFVEVQDTHIIGVSPSFDCTTDQTKPLPATEIGFRGPRHGSGM